MGAALLWRQGVPERFDLGRGHPVGHEAVDADVLALAQPPAEGTPLYRAGNDSGDRIVRLGRTTLTSTGDWDFALARIKPCDAVAIRYVQRGIERTATMTAVSDPTLEVVRSETIGQPLTARQVAFRKAWLGGE